MSNRALFNETVQKIMSALVDACPESTHVGAAELGLAEGKSVDGRYESTGDEEFLWSCHEWLKAEGLISGARGKYKVTLLGLELFGALPECFSKKS
ncbi:hypothetical protein [Pseudomonas chlororaphis]|uniref:hypothetical protein n=1 Tax=Pseudomonas chlororaphis TaxID=587753 RepID=UPI00131A5364|nr:hypothetical protein [Pseudomonas chlororaphis]